MSYQNKFLNDFIVNQQKMAAVDNANDKKDKKGRTKSRHGTKTGKKEVSNGDAFTLLCEEAPGKAKVMEYFRDRIAELTAEELANS
jgi:hypothetical protein